MPCDPKSARPVVVLDNSETDGPTIADPRKIALETNGLVMQAEGTQDSKVSLRRAGDTMLLKDGVAGEVDLGTITDAVAAVGVLQGEVEAIDIDLSDLDVAVGAHLADNGNPHATTAAQVGAYSQGEIDNKLVVKADKNSHTTVITEAGWYRIAKVGPLVSPTGSFPSLRASAMFGVYDQTSGQHSATVFWAASHYGKSTLSLVNRDRYSGTGRVTSIRIITATTYDGAAVEVYIDGPTASVGVAMIMNYHAAGWTLVDFEPADELPPGFNDDCTFPLHDPAVGDVVQGVKGDGLLPQIAFTSTGKMVIGGHTIVQSGGVGLLDLPGRLLVREGLEVRGDLTSDGNGDWVFDSNNGAKAFIVARNQAVVEKLSFWVSDLAATQQYDNDEDFSTLNFRIVNSDAETGGGANANETLLRLSSSPTESSLAIQRGTGVFNKFWHEGTLDPANYAPKVAPTFEERVTINSGGNALQINAGISDHAYVTFYVDAENPNTRTGFVGFGSAGIPDLYVVSEQGDVVLLPKAGSIARVGGSTIFHTGNFDPATKADADHNHDLDYAPKTHSDVVDGNPHGTTAAQVGAYTTGEVDAALLGKADVSALNAHLSDSANPHGVTAAQVGAPTTASFNNHLADNANPHGVTAAQVGASPATHDHAGVYEPAGADVDWSRVINEPSFALDTHDHDGVYRPVGVNVPIGEVTDLQNQLDLRATDAELAAVDAKIDAVASGLVLKLSVRVLADTNIDVSAPGSAPGGVSLAAGDNILLTGQTDPTENGPYTWDGAATPLTRIPQADEDGELKGGDLFVVREGAQANTVWMLTSPNGPVDLGVDSIVFEWFPSAQDLVVGDGLTRTGVDIAVDFAADGVASAVKAVRANDLRLSDARTPTSHAHPIGEVTGLQAALDGKADDADLAAKADVDTPEFTGGAIVIEGASATSRIWFMLDGGSQSAQIYATNVSGSPEFEATQDFNAPVLKEAGVSLASKYATAGHNHDGVYSPAGHNHDGVYSPSGHNHDGDYAIVGHTQDWTTIIGRPTTAVATIDGLDTRVTDLENASPSGGGIQARAAYVYNSGTGKYDQNGALGTGASELPLTATHDGGGEVTITFNNSLPRPPIVQITCGFAHEGGGTNTEVFDLQASDSDVVIQFWSAEDGAFMYPEWFNIIVDW